MDHVDLLGAIAGSLTTLSFIPQVWKTWCSRSAGDISLGMFVLFSLGVALWLAYGVLIDATPIVLSNTVTLVLAGSILVMKFLFRPN